MHSGRLPSKDLKKGAKAMEKDPAMRRLEEAIKRWARKPYHEQLEELRQQGIVNEKGEVIVRMPIGSKPDPKLLRAKRADQEEAPPSPD
jgi:hypothetical protein